MSFLLFFTEEVLFYQIIIVGKRGSFSIQVLCGVNDQVLATCSNQWWIQGEL